MRMREAARIQVVTQVFAELWKDNHHAYFQLINKKKYRKQIPISPPLFFLFQCLYAKKTPMRLFPMVYSWTYNYSLWCIPGRTIIPGYSRIFLGVQLFLRSCADQEGENHQIFGFVGLVLLVYFHLFDAVYGFNVAQ